MNNEPNNPPSPSPKPEEKKWSATVKHLQDARYRVALTDGSFVYFLNIELDGQVVVELLFSKITTALNDLSTLRAQLEKAEGELETERAKHSHAILLAAEALKSVTTERDTLRAQVEAEKKAYKDCLEILTGVQSQLQSANKAAEWVKEFGPEVAGILESTIFHRIFNKITVPLRALIVSIESKP